VEDMLDGIRFHSILLLLLDSFTPFSYSSSSTAPLHYQAFEFTECDNTLWIVQGVTFHFTLFVRGNCIIRLAN